MSDPVPSIPPDLRNPIIHDQAPSRYTGEWRVTDAALAAYAVARDEFGTTTVVNPDGTSFRVKDYQYRLPGGGVGMQLIPVNDAGPFQRPDGRTIYRSELIDTLLRDRMGLTEQDPIYALIYYIHPELNHGSVLQFAGNDKVELGITHMGAYLGQGRTSNSPPLYHNRGWGVIGEPGSPFGYPANIAVLSMSGTDQAMLNKNLYLADCVLNNGVRFPTDYKNSQYRMANLNTAFMVYRDWVLERDYLRKDTSWFTYCAAHKSLVANIGLNLPHNLESFKDVYGLTVGSEFFQQFSEYHFQTFGTVFTEDLQTDFEPLWRKQGIAPERARALTMPEYSAWDTARRGGQLASFDGFVPLALDEGSAWAPVMTADLVAYFVQTYADFLDAGGVVFSAAVLGFAGPVTERMRLTKLDYLLLALPMVQLAMKADARTHASVDAGTGPCEDSPYYQGRLAALYSAFGGSTDNQSSLREHVRSELASQDLLALAKALAGGTVDPGLLAWTALAAVRADWPSIIAGGQVPAETAYVDLMQQMKAGFDSGRDVVVSDRDGIQYNTPPAIGHMIATGMASISPFVTLTPVATAMHHTELEPIPA